MFRFALIIIFPLCVFIVCISCYLPLCVKVVLWLSFSVVLLLMVFVRETTILEAQTLNAQIYFSFCGGPIFPTTLKILSQS